MSTKPRTSPRSPQASRRASAEKRTLSNKKKPARTTAAKKTKRAVPKSAAPKRTAPKRATAAPKKKPARTASARRTTRRRSLQLIESPALMQGSAIALRRSMATIGFVPTMGSLHDAHLALLREARRRCDVLVASIFVNPKQFDDAEDLARYPRDLEGDRILCKASGVDILFSPGVEQVYPTGFDTAVRVKQLSSGLCGASRPGHFDGVCTVVTKLFNLVRPHFAIFGEKDYQQLTIVRRLVRDLSLPVEIIGLPVMREIDGLAMSSRNKRLEPGEREQSTALFRAIEAAQRAAERGERRSSVLVGAARRELDARPLVREEYVEIVDVDTLLPIDAIADRARILVAADVGSVRLIDNGPLYIDDRSRN